MPEVGLGFGRSRQAVGGIEREILAWSDRQGNYYPWPDPALRQRQLQVAQQRADAEQQRAEQERAEQERAQERAALAEEWVAPERAEKEQERAETERRRAMLRAAGIDPDAN